MEVDHELQREILPAKREPHVTQKRISEQMLTRRQVLLADARNAKALGLSKLKPPRPVDLPQS